jgi:hypothetical protein
MNNKLETMKSKMLVAALAVSFGITAYAEPPRDELGHAYRLLKEADHDYAGHRAVALEEIKAADRDLGIRLEGDLLEHERQWKSDERMAEANRLLRDARDKLEDHDRTRVAAHVEKAIKEIDAALKVR